MSGCGYKSDEEREFYIKLCIKEGYPKKHLIYCDKISDIILKTEGLK